MKKKILFIPVFLLSIILLFVSCNDAIFYAISQEVKPVDPRIPGATSNIVAFPAVSPADIYVGQARNLWKYNENTGWVNVRQNDRISRLAVVGNDLYVLLYNDAMAYIRHMNISGVWANSTFPTNIRVESIYGAGTELFIGAGSSVYALSSSGTAISGISGSLTGAAYNGTNYFISTLNGIYSYTSGTATRVSGSPNEFMGIIQLGTGVVAIRRNGELYSVTTSAVTRVASFSRNFSATGALAVWRDNSDNPRLLLAGRTTLRDSISSSHRHGYQEIELNDTGTGIKSGAGFRDPGRDGPSSLHLDGHSRYISTIGRRPVNHILQTPSSVDGARTLFASTQRDGLWSLRDRPAGFHWNAEY